MIVLAVIALIMGPVAPRVIGYFGRAKSQTAQIQMTHFKGELQLMYIDLGRYPSEAEGLAPLLTTPAVIWVPIGSPMSMISQNPYFVCALMR
ncbi:MAG: type II secretion system protein GspG [Rhodobacteraceae bacterium]|nr:type II secretion system protein GspG [Paracoccaceae bacterium]